MPEGVQAIVHGAGEQYVREHYPAELRAFRARAARAKTVFVVQTDADKLTVKERHQKLAEKLHEEKVSPAGPKSVWRSSCPSETSRRGSIT